MRWKFFQISQGANIQTYGYDEFGVHGTTLPARFGYTGQVYVPEAGLYYYKARMYSPGLGRFMQTDPIGYADGPNMYAYVGDDPVNAVDPWGLKKKTESCVTIGGAEHCGKIKNSGIISTGGQALSIPLDFLICVAFNAY